MIINSFEEFSQQISKDKAILAVDYGIKKIGMALSSLDHKISFPHKILSFQNEKEKIHVVATEITAVKAGALVLGMPINMDGSSSEQANRVQKFAEELSKFITIPIFLQDERLSSKEANNLLKMFNMNRRKREQNDDATAANIILETVLSRIKNWD